MGLFAADDHHWFLFRHERWQPLEAEAAIAVMVG
jgi:hypothetical protein